VSIVFNALKRIVFKCLALNRDLPVQTDTHTHTHTQTVDVSWLQDARKLVDRNAPIPYILFQTAVDSLYNLSRQPCSS